MTIPYNKETKKIIEEGCATELRENVAISTSGVMKNLFVAYMAPKSQEYGHCILEDFEDVAGIRTINDIRNIRHDIFNCMKHQMEANCPEQIVILNWKWMDQ